MTAPADRPADLSTPEPWETDLDWEIEVCVPVNRHMLAPRDARAILEVAGQLADLGMHADTIVNLLEGERGRRMAMLGKLPQETGR